LFYTLQTVFTKVGPIANKCCPMALLKYVKNKVTAPLHEYIAVICAKSFSIRDNTKEWNVFVPQQMIIKIIEEYELITTNICPSLQQTS
jgi:hypothetical protein